MTWNYRVMVRDGRYAVYSVYYADDGHISGWSEEPMSPNAESVEELGECGDAVNGGVSCAPRGA